MSIVSDAYEYDVFYSYAWATNPTGDPALCNWTRMVADTISRLVRVRFGSVGKFKPYLDRDANEYSAAELDATLQRAAESSAIFVAFISPYYQSDYCQKELSWFLERVKKQGSVLTDRMCLYVVQHVPSEQWPRPLREGSGTQLFYKEFHDGHGQPLEMAAFLLGAPTPLLAQPTQNAALEIGNKLEMMRTRAAAKSGYWGASRRKPVLYLEAEQKDEARWTEHRQELKKAANIILPAAAPPTPATALADGKATYADCDGVVLLRSRENDDIGSRLSRAYRDLRDIQTAQDRDVRWALLDELDQPSPEGEEYEIPRVTARGEWVPELRRILLES